MTSPVVSYMDGEMEKQQFILPSKNQSNAPLPSSDKVKLVERPEKYMAVRTFRGMDLFKYREDGVQRNLKQIEHQVEAHGVTFNIRFNVNEIGFVSRLNEDMMDTMAKANFY